MKAFSALYELLDHIKEVEKQTIELSRSSTLKLSNFIEEKGIEVDENVADALQYQDIISQQLSATIDAINYVQGNLKLFETTLNNDENIVNQSIDKLHDKLQKTLAQAKEKQDAFSGKLAHAEEDEIEFF